MTPLGLPPFLLVLIVAVIVFLLVATASQHRRHSSQTDVRLCRGCGAGHPAFAQFCRRCGRKL
jgi:ribosomal protein L40E